MAPPLSQNLTEMLQAWSRGDRSALDRLRYFAGLGIEETSEVLGVSPATVKRQWRVVRAWLLRELRAG